MISKKAQQQALRDDNVRLADWWDDLSDEGKQKYIQEHPGSEKAKGGGGVGDVEKSDVAPEKKLFDQAHEILKATEGDWDQLSQPQQTGFILHKMKEEGLDPSNLNDVGLAVSNLESHLGGHTSQWGLEVPMGTYDPKQLMEDFPSAHASGASNTFIDSAKKLGLSSVLDHSKVDWGNAKQGKVERDTTARREHILAPASNMSPKDFKQIAKASGASAIGGTGPNGPYGRFIVQGPNDESFLVSHNLLGPGALGIQHYKSIA